jgi:hypothetical protein
MDRHVTLEEFSGRGKIWNGGVVALANVLYSIRVSQRMIEARTMGGSSEIPGLKSIQGWIRGNVPFNLIGESIELELEDGRRWECFIQSSNGNLVNRGGIK